MRRLLIVMLAAMAAFGLAGSPAAAQDRWGFEFRGFGAVGTQGEERETNENGYGFDEIHQHRVARPPGPGIKERRIRLETNAHLLGAGGVVGTVTGGAGATVTTRARASVSGLMANA